MGQKFSKNLLTKIEQASKVTKQQLKDEALQDIKKKQQYAMKKGIPYSDPNALHGGFTRGQNLSKEHDYHYQQDLQQEEFLKSKVKGDDKNNTEMPDDLINFLKDVGPLQREVDKDFTSPRLRNKTLQEIQQMDDEAREKRTEIKLGELSPTSSSSSSSSSSKPGSDGRIVREMPMIENVDSSADQHVSDFKTKRTTNFSTKIYDDHGDLRDVDIYNMIAENNSNSSNDVNIVTKYLKKIEENNNNKKSNTSTLYTNEQLQKTKEKEIEDEKSRTKQLLKNTLKYIDVPIIMKDPEDNSLIGTYPYREEELQMSAMKLKPMSKKFIQLNIALEAKEEEEKKKKN